MQNEPFTLLLKMAGKSHTSKRSKKKSEQRENGTKKRKEGGKLPRTKMKLKIHR